ncbi:immune inhibitor A domain-containing protein [Cohnella luojiensis]|uniref:Peptidase M6 n=1 Tax=Cohnella luojiensis TaxID=652876 RepID=A0A4Y8LVY9_9BACL|nr:immune inhibitor A domain-containing protein [Cohnella luojiensis]TFE25987.1 peptidase M6 [Cohnella luojiensis]
MTGRKVVSLFTSIILAGSIAVPSSAIAAPASYNPNPTVLDIGPKLRSETVEQIKAENRLDLSGAEAIGSSAEAGSTATVTPDDVGNKVVRWVTHDDYTGRYLLTSFTLRAVGKYGEVWVANNLNYPSGDPRNSLTAITDAQVQYLMSEFDTKIYEKEVSFFAPPAERKGEHGVLPDYMDESGRVVILIDNIKDQSYYNPDYPSYIAGYFSPTISELSDRNVMTVDNFDWLNRTGPTAPRPFLYEGVFAHEFQHLLHSDTDSGEENFINEGLSDFAQYLVGYGHSQGHVDFFMNHLRNSLTLWGDQTDLQILADYGNAYLFQLYLYDRFGEAFIRDEFHDQLHGISSINDLLGKVNIKDNRNDDDDEGDDEGDDDGDGRLTFNEVYADFMTSIMLDTQKTGGSYKFDSIDLAPNVDGSVLPDIVSPAWGTDFKVIVPDKKIDHLYFKGLDFLRTNWTSATDPVKGEVLWGNTGDLADNFLIKELNLTGQTAPILSFDTSYNIEEQWDFGVVQVSTDNGKTWTSLSNANTRSDVVDLGYPKVKENLPGFTGSSNGWKTETFDLTAYAGQKVLLGFRYLTDWGFTESGWYLSNLKLNDATIDPMTTTSGFMSLEQATGQYVNYQVQFIGYKKSKGNDNVKVIRFRNLLNMSEDKLIDLGKMLRGSEYERIVMMTTYAAPEGTNASVSYEYEVVMKNKDREDRQNEKENYKRSHP